MSAVQAQPLPAVWKDRLDLSMRNSELYEDPHQVVVAQSLHAKRDKDGP